MEEVIMGRELRRKQAKKEGKKIEKTIVVEKNQFKSLMKITLLLVIIIGIIYLISALFITKELDWFVKDKDTGSEKNTVANSILASSIFNQTEEEYYVYFYDYDEEDIYTTRVGAYGRHRTQCRSTKYSLWKGLGSCKQAPSFPIQNQSYRSWS